MANTIDITATRTMIEAVQDIPPLPSFLKRTFFGGGEKHFLTEEVDFDYKKGTRKMAPFVARRVGGIPMERQGFVTKSIATPRISVDRVITVDDIKKRSMGEAVYSAKKPEERALEMEAQDYTELDEAISLSEEWECRQLLFEGKIVIKGETNSGDPEEMEVDYQFTNKEALTGSDRWTDPTADLIEQGVQWRKEIVAASGISPNIWLTDSETALMAVNHPNFRKHFDTRNYNFGTIEPQIKEPLLTFFGRIPILGADLFAYDASYVDPVTGQETPFIPKHTLLFASSTMPGQMYYGAITIMESTSNFYTAALPRVPIKFFDQDACTKTLRVQSRPLPMPRNVEGWAVRKVA